MCEQMYPEEKNAAMWDCCLLCLIANFVTLQRLFRFLTIKALTSMKTWFKKVKDEGNFNFKLNLN